MEESSAAAYPKQGVCFTCSVPCRVLPLLFHGDKPLAETTKYVWSTLVYRTRECVDRQKQFNCSQVAFLNPQPLTFKRSLTMVSTESTSITVLGKKNGKPKSRVCPFWKLAVHICALHLISFWLKKIFRLFQIWFLLWIKSIWYLYTQEKPMCLSQKICININFEQESNLGVRLFGSSKKCTQRSA